MIQREGEEWKNIIDFPIYQISNLGNVRNTKTEKELKPYVNNRGYYLVTLYRKDFKQYKQIHKLVCEYFNPNPGNHNVVDHVNSDKSDNRAQNLRFCTHSQNSMNMKKKQNSSSQFKGVCFHQQSQKWKVRIFINKKEIYLGLFTNEEEAARVYDAQAIINFGEFAKTNFPRENYQQQAQQQ